jgi:hypothetical protein
MSWKTFWAAFGVTVAVLLLCIWIDLVSRSNAEATDPTLAKQVQAHEEVLNAMGTYFSKLQDKGILPKPNEIEKFGAPEKKIK